MKNLNSKSGLQVFSRTVAAVVGGYVLSNLLAILTSYILPMSISDSVLLSLQLSFLFYSVVVIWVFSTKTASKAWLGLIMACAISSIGVYLAMPESLL
jgi:hypothetical protein